MTGLLFLIGSFVALIGAFILEGGHFTALFVGTAGMIVFGGTIGAVGLSYPLKDLKRFVPALKKALGEEDHQSTHLIYFFIDMASLVRREGVLALERYAKDEEINPLVRVGLQLVSDGVEKEMIRDILDTYVENTSERHKTMSSMFESAGGFAPTMGIIGTVLGLVHVLGNLSEPEKLGPSIAVAFIATLYGVATANVVWLPLGAKLKNMDKDEAHLSSMMVEGVLLIQAGANPRVVEEKLKAFLSPQQRAEMPGAK